MKKSALVLFIIVSCHFANAQNAQISQSGDIAAMEQKGQNINAKSLLSVIVNNYDINYARCEWQIDPSVYYIKGAITSYFKPTGAGFNFIEFDLTDTLTVDSVRYHSTAVTFSQLPTFVLHINLPSVIPVGTLDSITVYYQGTPAHGGFGTFNKTTHGAANDPIIWTLSEPFGAKDWWPCKQDLNDKYDSVDVIVTVPQANRVGSNGLLVSETTVGTDKIYHWKTKYRIAAYLVAVAVTNYAAYSDYVPYSPTDSLQVLNYVYPENLDTAMVYTPDIKKIITLYDSLTIKYPFWNEKYGHAEFNWGGGMEHQTMTFCVNFGHGLIAHECAHQWFGDRVTCGSWQDIWLNEGFATYFEGLTEERYHPDWWPGWKRARIHNVTSYPDGSVMVDDTTSVGRIFSGRLSYDKGSYLLHMLRWKMGDAAFFQGLRDYLNDPLLAYNYAKTPDLIAHLQTASGLSLTSFFNEWYYNQGFPSYQILYSQAGSVVNSTINQTTSHVSVPFYEMPVPIKFFGAGHDTTIIFNHTFSGQTFSATIPYPLDSIEFDPDLHILSANNTITFVRDLLPLSNAINVFPNPVKGNLSVSISLIASEELTFDLFDVSGKKVLTKKEMVPAGSSVKSVTTDNLAKGEYILKIRGNEINFSQKVLKQ